MFQKEAMRDKILRGDVLRTALTLAWPVMLSNAFQTVYNLTDTVALGARPGPAWWMMLALIVTTFQLTNGCEREGTG